MKTNLFRNNSHPSVHLSVPKTHGGWDGRRQGLRQGGAWGQLEGEEGEGEEADDPPGRPGAEEHQGVAARAEHHHPPGGLLLRGRNPGLDGVWPDAAQPVRATQHQEGRLGWSSQG